MYNVRLYAAKFSLFDTRRWYDMVRIFELANLSPGRESSMAEELELVELFCTR
jgi:hypothetical protein